MSEVINIWRMVFSRSWQIFLFLSLDLLFALLSLSAKEFLCEMKFCYWEWNKIHVSDELGAIEAFVRHTVSSWFFSLLKHLKKNKLQSALEKRSNLDTTQGVFYNRYYCTVSKSFVNSRRLIWISDLGAACWLSGFILCCPSWSVGEWGVCSRSCGGGEQTRQVQCVQRTSQTSVDDLADSRCAQPTPVRRQACSTHSCPPVWTTGPWSQVSPRENDLPPPYKDENF